MPKPARFGLKILSVVLSFVLLFTSTFSHALDFRGALEEGKSLGREDINKYKPSNLDSTLGDRGLGTAKENVPHINRAEQNKSNYTQFYTNPGGMGAGGDNPATDFLNTSYEQRQHFDLQGDPTFGNRCLQRDSENRCTMWSLSKDLLTNTYPDCEKVAIPRYGEVEERTCTMTQGPGIEADCNLRSFADVLSEEVQGPCSSVTIEMRPDQIYAVCRDYVDIYRVFLEQTSTPCGHYSVCGAFIRNKCNELGCYCLQRECPLNSFVVGSVGDLPPGAEYMGVGITYTISGESGKRVIHWSRYDYYKVQRPSVIERVYLRRDSTCGDRFEQFLNECTVKDYLKCDPMGVFCTPIILDGSFTGETVETQCQTYQSSIGGYQTQNCWDECTEPDYSECLNNIPSYCNNQYEVCVNNCTGQYNQCIDDCGTNQECRDNCQSERTQCESNCDENRTACLSDMPGECFDNHCSYQCETLTINNYKICSIPESTRGLELNDTLITNNPVRNEFTTVENGATITWVTVFGGPGVRQVNDWYSKFKFHCEDLPQSNCDELEAQGCRFYSQRCLDPDCNEWEYVYHCGYGGILGYTVAYNCAGELRCMGTDCVDASYEANTDFPSVAAAFHVLNQYRVDSKGNSIFPGEKRECQSSPKACCRQGNPGITISDYVNLAYNAYKLYSSIASYSTTWASYANAFTYVLTYGEAGSMSGLLGTTVSEALGMTTQTLWTEAGTIVGEHAVQLLGAEVVTEGAVTAITIDTALISALSTIATVITIALVVYSILKFIYDWYFQCEKRDLITSSRVMLRLCHYIGEYCAEKWVGYCVRKHKVFCCFNSILARIIHQQGRPQLGISWGGVSNPNCRGFTPEELASIDFSKIDLSEYIQYIKHKTELSPEEQEALINKIKQRYSQ